MRISIGSDHGGFDLKAAIIRHLQRAGHEVIDEGTYSRAPADFPDSAFAVARSVARRSVERGIVIDGAGSPSAAVANKVPGIRASVVWDEFTARISREHSDSNILALGAMTLNDKTALRLVDIWLKTEALTAEKYTKRIGKISRIEAGLMGLYAVGRTRRRVITEEEARRILDEGGEVVEGPDVIITPLASDRLRGGS